MWFPTVTWYSRSIKIKRTLDRKYAYISTGPLHTSSKDQVISMSSSKFTTLFTVSSLQFFLKIRYSLRTWERVLFPAVSPFVPFSQRCLSFPDSFSNCPLLTSFFSFARIIATFSYRDKSANSQITDDV